MAYGKSLLPDQILVFDFSCFRRRPVISMRVVLELQTGSQAGESVGIEAGQSASIGRSSRADFTVASDANMSSLHFGVSVMNSQCLVQDLDSKNGVRINGQRTKRSIIADGDQILAGTSIFSVTVETKIEPPPTPPSQPSIPSAITPETATPQPRLLSQVDAPVEPPPVINVNEQEPRIELVTLSYLPPGGSVRRIWLRPGESITIGRTANAEHVISDGKRLSSVHFQIQVESRSCTLRDLQSTNGTTVNAQDISETNLCDGDLIRAGGIDFDVHMKGLLPQPLHDVAAETEEAPTRGIRKVELPTNVDVPAIKGNWFPCGSGLRLFQNRMPEENHGIRDFQVEHGGNARGRCPIG